MSTDVHASQAGYLPEEPKVAIVSGRYADRRWFAVRDNASVTKIAYRGELKHVQSDWGPFAIADFSPLNRNGMFQVVVTDDAEEVDKRWPDASVPFRISQDAYVRYLHLAFRYYSLQRCGTTVPGFHGPCHLDDAFLKEREEHWDLTGGWHDAGDTVKFVFFAANYVWVLLELHDRLRPDWRAHGSPWGDVLDEARWGNDFLLKCQDPRTGRVIHGVALHAGGNCWTDNIPQSGDERLATLEGGTSNYGQWMFIAAQAKMARAFAVLDPVYARKCLYAAFRCVAQRPMEPVHNVQEDALAVVAWQELHRATGDGKYRDLAFLFAKDVLARQNVQYAHNQNLIRGFWYSRGNSCRISKKHCFTGFPLYCLAQLALQYPQAPDRPKWVEAIAMHVEDYLIPMSKRNAFSMIPYGAYVNPALGNAVTRPLAGDLTYRHFSYNEAQSLETAATEKFWHLDIGNGAAITSQAAALFLAEHVLGDGKARHLGLRQLEWMMGCNPKSVCQMIGAGVHTPFPLSLYVGWIPGGVINGFKGQKDDMPFMHDGYTLDWETTEFGYITADFVWAVTMLYEGSGVPL